jgi:protein-S-isoprenylcysteine O-methyltransferase Ste14
LNDDEARYLIDQYNKYVSWKTRYNELTLVAVAISVAAASLGVAVAALILRSFPTNVFGVIIGLVLLLLVLAMFYNGWRQHRRIERDYEEYEKRLVALENYRSEHRSLPDGVTFKLIVEKPGEADRLVKERP